MNLDRSDEENTALIRKLDRIIEDDRFPMSPRIMTLKAIRTKLRPEPIREPLPPPNITSRRGLSEDGGGADRRKPKPPHHMTELLIMKHFS
jgi:hypothetical protein